MNNVKPTPLKVRAIQLDLARQKETVDTICDFARFAARWGFNMVHLYLEGVVRTKSFPFRPEEETYAPDEMRRVVEEAGEAGIEIVPCVNTLGHAEHFLSCPQMSHLDEDATGFGGYMFSPTNPETYEFLDAYMTELAEIFPAAHFNIGCDEAWRLGRGTESVRRITQGEASYAGILTDHLNKCRDICQKLGKRMWIWDDLLELLTEDQIAEIPRDIVMVAWHYGANRFDYDGIQGHFNNLRRRDWFSLYDKLGFDALLGPNAKSLDSLEANTRIGRNHNILGGLQTSWEMSGQFPTAIMIQIAITGRYWSDPNRPFEDVVNTVMSEMLPDVDVPAQRAIRALLAKLPWSACRPEPLQRLLQGPATVAERSALAAAEALHDTLTHHRPENLPVEQAEIYHAVLSMAKCQVINGRLRMVMSDVVDPRAKFASVRDTSETLNWCKQAIDELIRQKQDDWKRLRSGIKPVRAHLGDVAFLKDLDELLTGLTDAPAEHRAMVVLRTFLYEGYSTPNATIRLQAGDGAWHEIASGCYKPNNLDNARGTQQFPIVWPYGDPVALRFSVKWFGGQGLTFASVVFENRRFVPDGVRVIEGQVRDDQQVLADNAIPCFLGDWNTAAAVLNRTDENASTIEISLRLVET